MRRIARVVCLLTLASSFALSSSGGTQTTYSRIFSFRERQMREKIRLEILPKYPLEALKDQASGIIVVKLEFDINGDVSKIELVETSHPAFVLPTRQALSRWKFNPVVTPDREVYGATGKLTFYFYFRGGRGWVEDPLVFKSGHTRSNGRRP